MSELHSCVLLFMLGGVFILLENPVGLPLPSGAREWGLLRVADQAVLSLGPVLLRLSDTPEQGLAWLGEAMCAPQGWAPLGCAVWARGGAGAWCLPGHPFRPQWSVNLGCCSSHLPI